ncbi:TetR/AcrR family transcriptional regulator [Streptomyces sp. Isolate_45]|uniref:TetR/AcrR family transcriptional regulator n=1 Tax=Streptomyces sp. Isolate_45 TaxID=2950111 RepID=UPI002481F708|nr:TetR/AcrR family transcriptional regulator [Streptomyces sp. Isolate_45]MDA5284976.1 TetR/AcrR family transcriptional regulator [Streptomyces sp. Isolate_45]
MNQDRRDKLRDAAVAVLGGAGGRGLTHRAVDAAADVPPGTTKNYFPTRDALLRAVAERCLEQYLAVASALAGSGAGSKAEAGSGARPGSGAEAEAGVVPEPSARPGPAAFLAGLLRDVAGPGRTRMLAYLELQGEAARRPWLAALIDPIGAGDFAAHRHLLEAAGLPAGSDGARTLTLALHGAIPHLLAGAPATLAAAGLDDPDAFARRLLNTVCPEETP